MAGFVHPFLPFRLSAPTSTAGFRGIRPFVGINSAPSQVVAQAGFRGIYPFITVNGAGDFIPPPPIIALKGGSSIQKDDEEILMAVATLAHKWIITGDDNE